VRAAAVGGARGGLSMTDRNISRRKVLGAVGTVGGAAALGASGTTAFFSDEEQFANNQLVAGSLDMKVGWEEHYSDWSEDEAEFAHMQDGELVIDDQEGFMDATLQEQFPDKRTKRLLETGDADPCEVLADVPGDLEEPVIDLDDVKPGDFGEVTFDFALCDNPGYVWMNGELLENAENSVTEPEADHPDEDDDTMPDSDGAEGELADAIQATIWYDNDGDNLLDDTELPCVEAFPDEEEGQTTTEVCEFKIKAVPELCKGDPFVKKGENFFLKCESGECPLPTDGEFNEGETTKTVAATVGENRPPEGGPECVIKVEMVEGCRSRTVPNRDIWGRVREEWSLETPCLEKQTEDDTVPVCKYDVRSIGPKCEQELEDCFRDDEDDETPAIFVRCLPGLPCPLGEGRTIRIKVSPEEFCHVSLSLAQDSQECMEGSGPMFNVRTDWAPTAEKLVFEGSLRDALDVLSLGQGKGIPLDGNPITHFDGVTNTTPGTDPDRDCFEATDANGEIITHSLGFKWELPVDHGNEVQSDSVKFDLGFYTEQCRHNDGSGVANNP
jgi:predicted ribosomally synthesized peptide with SipW-like signal peptide